MTIGWITLIVAIVIGVYGHKFYVWLRNDLKLRRMANEAHKDAMLTSSIHRAYAALEASDKLLYEEDEKR